MLQGGHRRFRPDQRSSTNNVVKAHIVHTFFLYLCNFTEQSFLARAKCIVNCTVKSKLSSYIKELGKSNINLNLNGLI